MSGLVSSTWGWGVAGPLGAGRPGRARRVVRALRWPPLLVAAAPHAVEGYPGGRGWATPWPRQRAAHQHSEPSPGPTPGSTSTNAAAFHTNTPPHAPSQGAGPCSPPPGLSCRGTCDAGTRERGQPQHRHRGGAVLGGGVHGAPSCTVPGTCLGQPGPGISRSRVWRERGGGGRGRGGAYHFCRVTSTDITFRGSISSGRTSRMAPTSEARSSSVLTYTDGGAGGAERWQHGTGLSTCHSSHSSSQRVPDEEEDPLQSVPAPHLMQQSRLAAHGQPSESTLQATPSSAQMCWQQKLWHTWAAFWLMSSWLCSSTLGLAISTRVRLAVG
jgi:hypothetical protein